MLGQADLPPGLAPDGSSASSDKMGDFSRAFAAFVGTDPVAAATELPAVAIVAGAELAKPTDSSGHEASPEELVEDPGAIVESIIEELLNPLTGATYIVQTILDDIIMAVPFQAMLLATPPSTLPLATTPQAPVGPAKVVRGKVQPPTQPRADRPGRVTNQLLYIKRKVMSVIWAHKFAWPFKKPVDAIKLVLPDYHTIIKEPMDFGTVRKRLNNKYYWSASECREDIRLVFVNCFRYNKPELDVAIMGRTLEKVCEHLMDQMPDEELDQEAAKLTAVKRKGRPPGESGARKKRASCDGDYVRKKARLSGDFESDIPVAQVGTHMGAYGLAPGKSTKRGLMSSDESDTEDDDSVGEFDELEVGRAPGARPSNHRPVPVPRTFQDERPGGLLTERKTIKNYCKYCDQAFLSKYVRDMHEKVKHGSGYISAEKPKKMPVIRRPKKEPKVMVPVKTEPNLAPLDSGTHDLVAGLDAASSQFSDHDLLNFVDKKHQAMNKQAKKNQSKTPIKKEAGRQNSQSNIRIPDDMLFPVPEELLLKQGYMHNSSSPAPGFAQQGNGSINGLGPTGKAGRPAGQTAKAPRAPRPSRAKNTPAKQKQQQAAVQEQLLANNTTDSKYDLQKELGFVEPTFTKSVLVTPAGQQPRIVGPSSLQQQLYQQAPATVRPSVVPSQEALLLARQAMRAVQPSRPCVLNSQPPLATYSPGPGIISQRSGRLSYEAAGLRSPEMQLARSPLPGHRTSVEEPSPGPFLTQQQQRPAVIQENNYRQTVGQKLTSSQSGGLVYSSPEPQRLGQQQQQQQQQQQAPRPIALESRSVIFPSKPLPKEELKQVQVLQPAPAATYRPIPPAPKPVIDVLAQTLQLSEIDGFDFTEEKDMPGLVSTQELTLGDLKHLRNETVTIPGSQMRLGGQAKLLPVSNGGHEKFEDLLDFSNITYQDVRQLIGPTENMIVYPEADGTYSEVIASGAQQTQTRLASQPHQITFPSTQSFMLQSSSLTTSTPGGSMPTFTTDLVYQDIASLQAGAAFSLPEQKPKQEKWWP